MIAPTPFKRRNNFSTMKASLVSVAGLIGKPIVDQNDETVGKVVDLVFRWNTGEAYPPLSGIIIKVGYRKAWVSAANVSLITKAQVKLANAKLDLRDFKPREGEVCLAKEVLDHQLVDVDGARVVRAADLYVAMVNGAARLVGVDVSLKSLLRRLGPGSLRSRPTPSAVIDWAAIQSFGQAASGRGLKLGASHKELRRLQPSELADLLEDLGRAERQELLESLKPEQAADALEEMEPDELNSLLRESSPGDAANYLMMMEPDEAADALRDMTDDLREDLLSRMPHESSEQVEEVLSYEEDVAGGIMNTAIITAHGTETVEALRQRLTADDDPTKGNDAIAVVDEIGRFMADISLGKLFLAEPGQRLDNLAGTDVPHTVLPEASIKQAGDALISNRSASLVVVDENNHPLGRILADDIIDALLPERGKFHFPRVLS